MVDFEQRDVIKSMTHDKSGNSVLMKSSSDLEMRCDTDLVPTVEPSDAFVDCDAQYTPSSANNTPVTDLPSVGKATP